MHARKVNTLMFNPSCKADLFALANSKVCPELLEILSAAPNLALAEG